MLKNREKSIITKTEILALIAFTALMLVLFFPKNSIQKHIEDEESNYDLTVIYLQNILKAYPDKKENYLKLAKIYLKMGKLQKSQEMLNNYNKNSDRSNIDTLAYNLLKSKYEKEKTAILKNQLKDKLLSFLATDKPPLWYFTLQEAKELKLQKLTLLAYKKRINHAKVVDEDEVIESYFLAKELKLIKDAGAILAKAVQTNNSPKLLTIYRQHFESQKKFQTLGNFFKNRYEKDLNKEDFLKATEYYFLDKDTKQALEFIKKHEDSFISDDTYAEKIIGIYLANKQLKKAREFSLKVMKAKGVL